MKALAIINWFLVACYVAFALFLTFDLYRGGHDPLGKGITKGILQLTIVVIVILSLFNLIKVMWMRILVLIISAAPVFYFLGRQGAEHIQQTHRSIKQRNGSLYFQEASMKALAVAIQDNDRSKVEELLDEPGVMINKVGVGKMTLLEIAMEQALVYNRLEVMEVVETLLEHGADPNIHGTLQGDILAQAAQIAPLPLFELLLANGADPDGRDLNEVPILFNLMRGATDAEAKVKLLFQYGADPNISFGDEGWRLNYSTAIYALSSRLWEITILLIEHGADLDFVPPQGDNFWQYYDRMQEIFPEEGKELPEGLVRLGKLLEER